MWPSALLEVSLCAIPKGDSPSAAPLKYHLIGVTSHVYRVWSGFRAAQINKEWIGSLVGESNFGGVPKRSAKMASLMDALAWEEANLLDIPYFGAYVDCSKCFDTLRYDDLLRVSRTLGLSEKITVPLGGWHKQHRRRILVGGWLQEGLKGNPAGVSPFGDSLRAGVTLV